MRILILMPAVFIAAAGALVSAGQTPPRSARDVAVALQQKYNTIRDFTADFVQESEGGVLRKKATERGSVQVKKPGKMRWDYTAPEKKVFVSDGRRIYLHVPADKQVIVSPVPQEDQATTAVLFLAGKGSLTRDFTVSFVDGGAVGTYSLRLQPRLPERDYDWLHIIVDATTLRIQSLSAADNQGGRSTFHFSNFKENVGLSDNTFAFKMPRGVDVISTGASAR